MKTAIQDISNLTVPEWIDEEDDVTEIEPKLSNYLGLLTYIFVVTTVFYVHRIKPVEHEILLSDTISSAPRQVSLNFVRKWVKVRDSLKVQFSSPAFLKDLDVRVTASAFEVEFGVSSVFSGGRAEVLPESRGELTKLAKAILAQVSSEYIEVEGYTDDVPVLANRNIFPSNWELSAARSASVVRELVDSGMEKERLKVVGYGVTRAKFANRDAKGEAIKAHQAKNRRLVVRVLETP